MLRVLGPAGPSPDSSDLRTHRRRAVADVLPGLYERVPMLSVVNMGVAVLLVIALAPVADPVVAGGWLAAIVLVLLFRLACWQRYRSDGKRHLRIDHWRYSLLLTTALTGASWGFGGALFHGAGSPAHDLLVAFALGGMIAGSAMALTAYLPLFFSFYVPAVLPYCIVLSLSNGSTRQSMAMLVAGFAVGIGFLARSIHSSLRANEERYRRVVEDQSELICRLLPDGRLSFVNGAYARAFGRRPEELVGVDFLTLLPEPGREKAWRMFSSLSHERPSQSYEHPVLRPDGGIAWQEWLDRAIFDDRGRLIEVQSVGRDITLQKEAEDELRRTRDELGERVAQRTRELTDTNRALVDEVRARRQMEVALRQSERRLRVALEAAGMGVFEQDLKDGRLAWSPEMERLAGLPIGSFGGELSEFLDLVHPDDRALVAQRFEALGDGGDPPMLEFRILRGDGALRWIAAFAEQVRHGGRTDVLAGVAMDITDRKLVEENALRLANHDPLTGLPNRRLLEDRLHQAFAAARRANEQVALFLLDLDDFKEVNDTRGHPVGDKLLCQVADRMLCSVRETDTLARLGGDEFAVIQTGLHDEEGAMLLAGKLMRAFDTPFSIDGDAFRVSASMGVSLFPGHGSEPYVLLQKADLALYAAKAEGRNRVRRFRPWMTAAVTARESLGRDLGLALERGELVLYYQPVLDISLGEIVGVEALLRWRRPDGRVLLPETFLPVAERVGLSAQLGEWVIGEAGAQAKRWHQAGRSLPVSINLSVAQIRTPADVAATMDCIAAAGCDPGSLELEITEGMFLDSLRGSRTMILDRLVELGIRLSVDDFGTGRSSLASFRDFPAGTIKIDRSLIRRIDRSEDRAVVVAILSLGLNLQRRVVAEGVERFSQMAVLHDLGCSHMQGFVIAKPLPVDDLEDLLRCWPSRWASLQRDLDRDGDGSDGLAVVAAAEVAAGSGR